MIELPYVGTPKPGDLLALSYSNGFEFGIFMGYGQGTVQFHPVTTNMEAYLKDTENHKRYGKPKVSYMGGSNVSDRVIRINPADLPPKKKAIYDEMIKILKV